MRVRRCTHLLLEPRETVSFGLQALLRGSTEANSTHVWLALAGHLDGPVEIDAGQSELLGRTSATQWRTLSAQDMADPRWGQLLSNGLLLAISRNTQTFWRATSGSRTHIGGRCPPWRTGTRAGRAWTAFRTCAGRAWIPQSGCAGRWVPRRLPCILWKVITSRCRKCRNLRWMPCWRPEPPVATSILSVRCRCRFWPSFSSAASWPTLRCRSSRTCSS